mmetsp:Transcript_103120/g.230317  ORF Transcript_103120/g.230317 Transcript_103120/m.230317 type:complete len:212 (-) Transcript_103120:196-831(-)
MQSGPNRHKLALLITRNLLASLAQRVPVPLQPLRASVPEQTLIKLLLMLVQFLSGSWSDTLVRTKLAKVSDLRPEVARGHRVQATLRHARPSASLLLALRPLNRATLSCWWRQMAPANTAASSTTVFPTRFTVAVEQEVTLLEFPCNELRLLPGVEVVKVGAVRCFATVATVFEVATVAPPLFPVFHCVRTAPIFTLTTRARAAVDADAGV